MEKGKGTVIFVALNAKYVHSSLSVWYLAAATRAQAPSLNPIVFEATTKESTATLLNKLSAHGAIAVCFSCYIWNIDKTLELAAALKAACPQAHIVLGGPEAEHQAHSLLSKHSFLSCISVGEGEESVPALLTALQNGTKLSGLNGVAYVIGNEYYYNKALPLLSEPPSPYTSEYLSALNGRMAYLETSRGCPYSCAFCLSGSICAPKWFCLERAKRDILTLASSGAKTIKLIDRTFNAKAAHANELWRFIADNYGTAIPNGICFHFEIAADIITQESIDILKKMPCGAVQLEAGIQSVNEQVLCAVHRKTNTKRLLENLEKLISFKSMHIHIDLIAGLPHEGIQSFIVGFNRVYWLKAHMLQLGFLKLLHGSAMREQPHNYPCEFKQEPPYEIISTPWLSAADIKLLHTVEDAVERLYNSQRFLLTLAFVIEKTGFTPFEAFAAVPIMPHKTSLEQYAAHVLASFSALPNIQTAQLRDIMAIDFLAFNRTGRLPRALAIPDRSLRAAVKALAQNKATAPLPQTKRGVALIYTQNKVAYADYISPNKITGRYEVKLV